MTRLHPHILPLRVHVYENRCDITISQSCKDDHAWSTIYDIIKRMHHIVVHTIAVTVQVYVPDKCRYAIYSSRASHARGIVDPFLVHIDAIMLIA